MIVFFSRNRGKNPGCLLMKFEEAKRGIFFMKKRFFLIPTVMALVFIVFGAVVSCSNNVYIDDENYHSIVFDANGGEGKMDIQVVEGQPGVMGVINKNTFRREGYSFAGWNTEPDGSGTSYANEDKICMTDHVKLYAQWVRKTVTITFHANGGEGEMSPEIVLPNIATPLSLNTFTREHYIFLGWNTKPDGGGVSFNNGAVVLAIGNTDLYAMWILETFSITFNANGGEGEMYPQVFSYGTETTLDTCGFEKEGFEFIGWNTDSQGAGQTYSDGETVALEGNTVLFAIWGEAEE